MSIRTSAIERLVDSVYDDINNFTRNGIRLKAFGKLSTEERVEVLELILLAFKNVIPNTFAKGDVLSLPFLAKFRIKETTKVAIEIKQEIANEMGYNSYDSIPKDKIEEAKAETRNRIISRKETTKKRVREAKKLEVEDNKYKPVGRLNNKKLTKIQTFNIKSINKT